MNKKKFQIMLFSHRIPGEERYFYIYLVRINNIIQKFGYDFCIEQNMEPTQVFYNFHIFRASEF